MTNLSAYYSMFWIRKPERTISILQEELFRVGVLPEDYNFENHRELVIMHPGDVPVTYADSEMPKRDYGFKPSIDIRAGLRKFAGWYKGYYIDGKR